MEIAKRIQQSAVRKINEDERVIEFVASDATPDSYDTVIPVSAWNLERFKQNGIIGYQHDVYYTGDPDSVIGVGEAFIEDDKLIVRVKFEPADLNEKADKIYRKVLFGSIKGVSVGFSYAKGHWGTTEHDEDENLYYFDEVTLLEVSVVNIPANPNAVKRSLSDDELQFRGRNKKEIPEEPEEKPEGEDDEDGKKEGEDDEDEDEKEQEETKKCLTIAKASMVLAHIN